MLACRPRVETSSRHRKPSFRRMPSDRCQVLPKKGEGPKESTLSPLDRPPRHPFAQIWGTQTRTLLRNLSQVQHWTKSARLTRFRLLAKAPSHTGRRRLVGVSGGGPGIISSLASSTACGTRNAGHVLQNTEDRIHVSGRNTCFRQNTESQCLVTGAACVAFSQCPPHLVRGCLGMSSCCPAELFDVTLGFAWRRTDLPGSKREVIAIANVRPHIPAKKGWYCSRGVDVRICSNQNKCARLSKYFKKRCLLNPCT